MASCGRLLAQVHDQRLLIINNHLVNGGGNELDGSSRGGGGGGNQLNTLKEEILTELERRVSLSCSACQVKRNMSKSGTNIKLLCSYSSYRR